MQKLEILFIILLDRNKIYNITKYMIGRENWQGTG